MNGERKKLRFEILFERYFLNFPKIILINLIFLIPSAVALFLGFLISHLIFSAPVIPIVLIGVFFAYPFFAGVVLVTRDIARGDDYIPVWSLYIEALRNNFLLFMLHGFILYLICALSYFAITFYVSVLSVSWIFYVALFITILIAIFLLFSFYYIPLMTVTFDINLKYIYKNSLLMSFGEIKNNFFATIALLISTAIFYTIIVFCTNVTVLLFIIGALWGLLVPATCTYVVNYYIYDGMFTMISGRDEKLEEIDERIKNDGKPIDKTEYEDFSDIDVSKLKDTDDYIFYNGKMIKQSTILKQIKEKNNKE
ncbi:MAG: DUF624 domain-containing protein [Oscillospiraceae bacterium]|nr:DUF624 domain-containing protein [Candidatus Ruminococcus equi]